MIDTKKATATTLSNKITNLISSITDLADATIEFKGKDSWVLSLVSSVLSYGAAVLATTDGITDEERKTLEKSYIKLMAETGKTFAKALGKEVGDPFSPAHAVISIVIGFFMGYDQYWTSYKKYTADGLPSDIVMKESIVDAIVEATHEGINTGTYGIDDVVFDALYNLAHLTKSLITGSEFKENDKNYAEWIGELLRRGISDIDDYGIAGDDVGDIDVDGKRIYLRGDGNDFIRIFSSNISFVFWFR